MEDEVPIIQSLPENHAVQNSSSFMAFYGIIKLLLGAEFSVFLYAVASGIFLPTQQRFVYEKICLYKFRDQLMCANLDSLKFNTDAEERAVQSDNAVFSNISTFCGCIPAIFVTLIMGSWSDRFSFRIPLALPHIGLLGSVSFYFLFAYLPIETLNPIYYGLFSVISGLSGSGSTAIMVCASYVSRISSSENRILRLAIIDSALTVGSTLGYLLYALILHDKDPLLAFLIQIAIHSYAVVIVFFMVRELHKYRGIKEIVASEANGSWCRFVFTPRREVFDAFVILAGRAPKYANVQRYLIALIGIYAIVSASNSGLSTITYLFLTMKPISISPNLYALFLAASCVGGFLSLMVFMPLLRYFFKFSDATFLIMGVISRMLSLFILGFGGFFPLYAPWAYTAAALFAFYPYVCVRSGLSKLIFEPEQGRMFSALSLIDNGAGIIATFVLNSLYQALVSTDYNMLTMSYFFHGFTIMFVGGACFIPLMLSFWLGRQGISSFSFHSSIQSLTAA